MYDQQRVHEVSSDPSRHSSSLVCRLDDQKQERKPIKPTPISTPFSAESSASLQPTLHAVTASLSATRARRKKVERIIRSSTSGATGLQHSPWDSDRGLVSLSQFPSSPLCFPFWKGDVSDSTVCPRPSWRSLEHSLLLFALQIRAVAVEGVECRMRQETKKMQNSLLSKKVTFSVSRHTAAMEMSHRRWLQI